MQTFEVQEIQPFLVYKSFNNAISLHAELPALYSSIDFDELFTNELEANRVNTAVTSPTHVSSIIVMLSNEIAHSTRRSAGNIVFMNQLTFNKFYNEIIAFISSRNLRVITSEEIPENQIRVTYWKAMTAALDPTKIVGVDGGIQVYDNKICLNHNHKNYFWKAVLP